jgi:hypothetical protein
MMPATPQSEREMKSRRSGFSLNPELMIGWKRSAQTAASPVDKMIRIIWGEIADLPASPKKGLGIDSYPPQNSQVPRPTDAGGTDPEALISNWLLALLHSKLSVLNI